VAYVLSDPSETHLLSSALLADVVGPIFAAVFRIERVTNSQGCLRAGGRINSRCSSVGEDEIPAMEELERRYLETTERGAEQINLPDEALLPPSPSTPSDTEPKVPKEEAQTSTMQTGDQSLQIAAIPHIPIWPVRQGGVSGEPQSACRATKIDC
jgi:hypothetical protein